MQIPIDPNVAYLLLVGGFLLAILATFSPGTGVIEITAIFMLVLAGYGMYNLPINIWALAILIIGVFPMVIALRRSSNWWFGIAALAALIIGSTFLFRLEDGSAAVNPILAALVSILAGGFLWLVIKKGMEAIKLSPSHNLASLVGAVGEARTDINRQGSVYVQGEEWSAVSISFIQAGSPVRVISREGLVLRVESFTKSNQSAS